jgi:hypothetical protein
MINGLIALCLVFVLLGLLGVWDIWLLVRHGESATITHQLGLLARAHPVIPYLVGVLSGVLAGHLWR